MAQASINVLVSLFHCVVKSAHVQTYSPFSSGSSFGRRDVRRLPSARWAALYSNSAQPVLPALSTKGAAC